MLKTFTAYRKTTRRDRSTVLSEIWRLFISVLTKINPSLETTSFLTNFIKLHNLRPHATRDLSLKTLNKVRTGMAPAVVAGCLPLE